MQWIGQKYRASWVGGQNMNLTSGLRKLLLGIKTMNGGGNRSKRKTSSIMNSNMATGNVLILGSKGMLGSQLMRLYGSRAVGWFKDDQNGFDFTNLVNFKTAISELNPTIIINCVAYNDVDGAEDEKNKNIAFQINAT